MIEFAPFRLDTANQCLWRLEEGRKERLLLRPKAFAVLRYLVDHAGHLVTQEELLDAVWSDVHVEPEVLKRHIFEIRKELEDDPAQPRFIQTLPRLGYQFIAAVHSASSVDAPIDTPAPERLVGRGRALGELRACFQRAARGERQIVFVTGEPGIGKTALVDECQREASRLPLVRVARGQCVEGYGGREAYYPILEALGGLCRGPDQESLVEILAAQAPTCLVQFPALLRRGHREKLQREIMGATRQRMLREICDALVEIASNRPLLLVLEDLHWSDDSTIDFISALARGRGAARLMLAGTYRPADATVSDHPLPALKQDLLVHKLCREIAVEPLAEIEIAEYLVGSQLGSSAPEGLAGLLHRHSDGNPLFIVEALRDLQERGYVSRESGGWVIRRSLDEIDLGVPESLRLMIETQIDRLSVEEQRVLEAASLESIDRSRFVAASRAALAEMEPEAYETVCEALARRNCVLRPAPPETLRDGSVSPCYEFVHALYREVCFRRISPRRQAKLHRRIGEWIEMHWEPLDEAALWMAGHFDHSAIWPRAIHYLGLAAENALRRFEPAQATKILDHALKLVKKLPDSEQAEEEVSILERLAAIYALLGDVRCAETYTVLSARAAHCGRIDVEVRALVELAFIESIERSDSGVELLERAFQLVAKLDPVKHLPTHAACLFFRLWLCGWNSKHAEEYRKTIDEIRKLGSGHIVARHLLDYSCIQCYSSEYREAHRSYADSLKMLLDVDSVHMLLSGIRWVLAQHIHPFDLVFLGEWGEASREIEEVITRADKSGDYFCRDISFPLYRAWLHLHACDFAGVLTICESAVPLVREPALRPAPDSPPPPPWPFQQSLVLRGLAETALGEYDRAREYLFAARDDMDRQRTLNDWYWRMSLEWGLAELWLAVGDLSLARPQAERFLSLTLTTAERTWQALGWEANARVALTEPDAPRAQEYIAKALSTMEGFELPLASWRVHATAFELYRNSGERDSEEHHHALSRETIMKLANSLPADDPLRQTFLSAPRVLKIIREGKSQSLRGKEA